MSSTSDSKRKPSFRGDKTTADDTFDAEQSMMMLKYGAMAIFTVILLKLIVQTMAGLTILLFPGAYLYAVATCPKNDSFDEKKQLKRVLRGHHLPEDHPEKPKGLVGVTLARVQASVAGELTTLLPHEIETYELAFAAIVKCARYPAAEREFYWIGIANEWYYIGSLALRARAKVD